ncbi:MAG: class IV adenylate cyclase [Phycisphaerales bacterium]|nr:class IV adenylate cyclase [Phycisphaerales bacterium]
MHNIEFKAELRDLALARQIAISIGAKYTDTVEQTDTYYRLADGRLKRREARRASAEKGVAQEVDIEVIHYHRVNTAAIRPSRFNVYTAEQASERFGATPGPVWVVVTKLREVYLYEGVRVHLDQVLNLGTFIEFEAPVRPEQAVSTCREIVQRLRDAFRPAMGEPISTSYSDLLAEE